MSKDFKTEKRISMAALFDGRLKEFGVWEYIEPDPWSDWVRFLTDGPNRLLIYEECGGRAGEMTCNFSDHPEQILNAISQAFNTDIFTEHDPQFYGFDNQAEFDLWMRQ